MYKNILVKQVLRQEKLLEDRRYCKDQARKEQIEIIYMQHIETPEALTSEDWRYLSIWKVGRMVFRSDTIYLGRLRILGSTRIRTAGPVVCRQNIVSNIRQVGFEYG